MPRVAMHAPLNAAAVADWFVERAMHVDEQDLSNLKLQKLLYLAHSLYLFRHRMPLIAEEVQAWENGPAVKPVYGLYKEFGSGPIRKQARLEFPRREWPADIEDTLSDVWSCFAGYSAWKLREITHVAGPWKSYWQESVRNVVIPTDDICRAWPEFEAYAESPLVARTDTTASALARYGALINKLPTPARQGDLSDMTNEAQSHSDLTKRASSLLA